METKTEIMVAQTDKKSRMHERAIVRLRAFHELLKHFRFEHIGGKFGRNVKFLLVFRVYSVQCVCV